MGVKTAMLKKLSGAETFSLYDGVFQKTNVWGSRGSGYQIYAGAGAGGRAEPGGTCNTDLTDSTADDSNQGAMPDPCGYGGCCWIHDRTAWRVSSTGSGCCQNCGPRGGCNAYLWVR